MLENIYGFISLVILSSVVALAAYMVIRKSVRALLDEVIKLPSGTTFYSCLLAICLFFIALSAALSPRFDLKPDAAFMEYVWRVAGGLSTVFSGISLFLTAYLVVITILVAVLGRRHD